MYVEWFGQLTTSADFKYRLDTDTGTTGILIVWFFTEITFFVCRDALMSVQML